MKFLKAEEKVGEYILLDELGSGTSGTVWKAKKGEKIFAMKFFKPGFEAHAKEEFELMQKIEHRNIIDEYETGQYKGAPFMVMDYLEGKALEDANPADFSPEEIENLAINLAEGLKHAHDHEIIHRDLKPANIFITKDAKVKILDFGASAPISYNPHQKLVADSYSYMSPEQLAGRANFQNDIWSYGVTFYKFLTGVHPYESNTIEELSEKMLLLEVDFPHHLDASISPKLSYIIMKCLRKNVPDRYRNFEEVLRDLKGDPVREIIKKFGGRRRMLKKLKFAEKALKVSKNVENTTEALGCLTLPLSVIYGVNMQGFFQHY